MIFLYPYGFVDELTCLNNHLKYTPIFLSSNHFHGSLFVFIYLQVSEDFFHTSSSRKENWKTISKWKKLAKNYYGEQKNKKFLKTTFEKKQLVTYLNENS